MSSAAMDRGGGLTCGWTWSFSLLFFFYGLARGEVWQQVELLFKGGGPACLTYRWQSFRICTVVRESSTVGRPTQPEYSALCPVPWKQDQVSHSFRSLTDETGRLEIMVRWKEK